MKRMVFKIQGLDCAEEVAILRRAVGPVVGGADNLSCDILHSTMTVFLDDGTGGEEAILRAVRKTGMHASLWPEPSAGGAARAAGGGGGGLGGCELWPGGGAGPGRGVGGGGG